MCWPRKRGLDPDAGKGSGDEGEGRVKRLLGNRMDRAWGPETVRVREEVETRAALGFLAWETGQMMRQGGSRETPSGERARMGSLEHQRGDV